MTITLQKIAHYAFSISQNFGLFLCLINIIMLTIAIFADYGENSSRKAIS